MEKKYDYSINFEKSKTDEVFDFLKSEPLVHQNKYLLQLINRSKNMNTNDLVFIHNSLKNPEVSGQDWGNGPGSWDALEECKARYPDADEFETFSVSNSNIWQPSTEGCIARFYKNEQIRRKIEDILGMSSEKMDRIPYSEWGEERNLNAVDFDQRRMSMFPHVREDVKRRFISLRDKSPCCMEILGELEKNPILLERLLKSNPNGDHFSNKELFEKWLEDVSNGEGNIRPFVRMYIDRHEKFLKNFLYGLYGMIL